MTQIAAHGEPTTWVGVLGVHADRRGSIGAVVELRLTEQPRHLPEVRRVADAVAKQLCSFNAKYNSRADVPSDVVEQEKAYLRHKASQNSNEAILQKMIQVRLEKFFQENCLLEQSLLDEADRTVGDLLASLAGEEGCRIILGTRNVFRTPQPCR